jgi:WD40 repeat protein
MGEAVGGRQRLIAGISAALSVAAGMAVAPLASEIRLPVIAASVLCAAGIGGYAMVEWWRAGQDEPDRPTLGWASPSVGDEAVARPELTARLIRLLTEQRPPQAVVSIRLQGAGGFGKTTLAAQVCQRADVRARFPGGLAWITVGRGTEGAALAAKMNSLARLAGQAPPTSSDPEQAGRELVERLAKFPPALLVIDDVWTSGQLSPMLCADAPQCVRLVTTRRPELLPRVANPVDVDEMTPAEAEALLCRGIGPPMPVAQKERLLTLTGRWPLLLALVNGGIRRSMSSRGRNLGLAEAAERIIGQLTSSGPAVLDVTIERQRNLAVSACIEYSLGQLAGDGRNRFLELGIFPSDASVATLELLWRRSAGLGRQQTELLCEEMADLSLLRFSGTAEEPAVQVHDAVRDYARAMLTPAGRVLVNTYLLAAARALISGRLAPEAGPTPWWTLPGSQSYLRRDLAYHLAQANLTDELNWLVTDLRWLVATIDWFDPVVAEANLAYARSKRAQQLSRAIAQSSHLLTPVTPAESLGPILLSRLSHIEELRDDVAAYQRTLRGPLLTPLWPLPDSPDRSLLRVMRGPKRSIWTGDIAPDGSWIATVDQGGVLCIWDIARHAITLEIRAHDSLTLSCAVSPDGERIATSCLDGMIRLWDARAGALLWEAPAYTGVAHDCSFSPDGRWLVTAGYDGRIEESRHGVISEDNQGVIRLWDSRTGRRAGQLSADVDEEHACAFSPDGGWLLSGASDGTARLWHLASGTARVLAAGSAQAVTACAFSPDGSLLATAGEDGVARLWNAATGECVQMLALHTRGLMACCFSGDGKLLATASEDGTARLWDPATGECVRVLSGHDGWVVWCAFVPHQTWLATGGQDGSIRLWDHAGDPPQSPQAPISVSSCAVAPGGKWIATGGSDGILRLWDAGTGRPIDARAGHDGSIGACAIFPDGSAVLTVGVDGTVRIWASAGDRSWPGHAGRINGCAIAPDGRWIATAGSWQTGSAVLRWDPATGSALGGPLLEAGADLRLIGHKCAIFPDGRRLLGTGSGGRAAIWDAQAGTMLSRLAGHSRDVLDCDVAPDGGWLATGSLDRTVRVWDADSGRCLRVLAGHDSGAHCAISGNGRWLATVSGEFLRIWDPFDGECVATMRVDGSLYDCCWFPDKDALCAAGERGLYGFAFRADEANRRRAPAPVSAAAGGGDAPMMRGSDTFPVATSMDQLLDLIGDPSGSGSSVPRHSRRKGRGSRGSGDRRL